MSDEKLRELERRFKETGSVEDEAAWLKERVRVGDLTQERLELAAYCGHGGARTLSASTVQECAPRNLGDWVGGLVRWGRGVFVFVAERAVSLVQPQWARTQSASRCVTLARAWLQCRTTDLEELDGLGGIEDFDHPEHWHACFACFQLREVLQARTVEDMIQAALNCCHETSIAMTGQELDLEPSKNAKETLLIHLECELGAWSLNADPI